LFFSLKFLGELNGYVATSACMEPLTEELLTQYSVVVLSNSSLEEQLRVAEITRKHNIALIIAGTPGQQYLDIMSIPKSAK
jgi:ubiquitin-activating enzyme E1